MNIASSDRAYVSKIERLEIENEKLRSSLVAMSRCSSAPRFPSEWQLEPQVAQVLALLVDMEWLSRDLACNKVCRSDATGKQLDVQICKLRKRLKPFGIKIETLWGKGYLISPSHKKRLAQAIEAAQ